MRRQRRGNMIIIRYIFTLFFAAGLHLGSAVVRTSITPSQFITDPESIVSSKDGIFRLGFFTLGDSRNRYVGIWYNNIPGPTIVWAANRDHPLNDSTGVFKIASDGNLVVLDGQGKLYWTSNVTDIGSDQLVAKLLDTGNLVLRESQSNEGRYLWQSFDHPTDTFLPNMLFGVNLRKGEKQTITSWKNDSDPSTGDFSLELDPYVIPQLIIKNGAQKKWRIGPGVEGFLGENGYSPSSLFIFQRDYSKGTAFLSLVYHEKSALSRIVLESDGKLVEKKWHEETKEWRVSWSPDIYNNCGPFGIYNQDSRTCSCMRGFEPKFRNESKEGNWTGGCSRRRDLQCEILRNKTADQNSDRITVKEADGFLEVASNVPDYFHWSPGIGYEQCRDKCLHNCACTAYSHSSYRSRHGYSDTNLYNAYFPEMGCMLWTRDLMDTRDASFEYSFTLFIRVANSEVELDEFPTDKGTNVETIITLVLIGIVLTSVGSYLCWILMGKQIRSCLRWIGDQSGFICCYFLYLIGNMRRGMRNGVEWERKRRPRKKKKRNMRRSLVYSDAEYGNYGREESDTEMLIGENTELKVIEFKTLAIATNNFSEANMLGHGGFGSVYKGTLRDGLEEREIAVKRLSKNSEQGSQEFKNEVLVISKLQHRNLVRLLGCCTHEEEKMLTYEYMPNKSLDAFLFDPTMRGLFDWKKRFEIILGISRGILYLHRDSRLRVIHRDLKASNILLDEELNPKISDFGMARIFGGNQRLQANTRKVAGTFGYMSPEYVIEGRFSEKSDVFSFGVLLLEIVSGKKNSSLCDQELSLRLLGHAWQLWNENNALALVDPTLVLSEQSFEAEILRCIHVGLLCVEEFAVDRPTMATTLSMLTSEIATLPAPKNPAFTERRVSSDSSSSRKISDNNVSITILGGR